ncbi:GPALPP motifs-containing protein 1 [Nymphaea thermarum]|nr:GPALPP motifs-containing protein 1 [Nymphaea thermarum]
MSSCFRYWKLSLLVHPDKCSHPQAHQAFVLLNQAFKELQNPDKRKLVDEKILQKEELEEFKAELQAHREAAKWRQMRGESLPGDEELLAGGKQLPTRDEWMTTLPPERAPGLSMHSTSFSKGGKEGRGDTSLWTDTPDEIARKARMRNLITHNTISALADDETANRKKQSSSDAELVDAYQSSKRSKTLLQKHQEAASSAPRKKQNKETIKQEWAEQHPWKPWNRETDLAAGRQKVELDSKDMAQGLASRFSSGSFQRNFL